MSWDYVVDKNGCLEVIVSRWFNRQDEQKVIKLMACGFEPYEPVQVEHCGADESMAVKPFKQET